MKKILTIIILILPVLPMAQSVEEVDQLLRYRKYVTATQKAEQMITTNPLNPVNWYWLSQVLLQHKDSTALNLLTKKIPASIQNEPFIKVVKGNIALINGNRNEARIFFDEAIDVTRSKDKNILVAIARVNIYNYENGDKEFALELLKKAIKKDRKNPALHTLVGDAWFRLKNGSEAYQAFENAIHINQNYAPALYELGKIFATQNNEALYLKYFNATINADPSFAPALYDLYYHYYKKDPPRALEYLKRYLDVADVKPSDEYQLADMLYLAKQYTAAIQKANALLAHADPDNRLNKLLAYIFKEKHDADSAAHYMRIYLSGNIDSGFIVHDYKFMIDLLEGMKAPDSAIAFTLKLLPVLAEKDKAAFYRKLADHYKEKKEYSNQATWLGKYYNSGSPVTNVDLFNWGLALYQAQDYITADSVFSMYAGKYPEQVFGYYWQARSNAAIDSTMERGLAVPHYKKMITIAEADTANDTNKRYLVEGYGYVAAYIANEEKDYAGAIGYFEKLLMLDPGNNDAKKYIEILEKNVSASSGR